MATIGVSKPYYALYQSEGGTVSYQGGGLMGRAVELSASIEAGEENNLYADNMVVESDSSFAGGTLTITTDDLLQEASKVLLGLKTNEVTVGEEKVTELVYDDEDHHQEKAQRQLCLPRHHLHQGAVQGAGGQRHHPGRGGGMADPGHRGGHLPGRQRHPRLEEGGHPGQRGEGGGLHQAGAAHWGTFSRAPGVRGRADGEVELH